MGLQCEIGLRCRTYYVLCGSVLSVWNEVELVLTPVGGTNVKVQIVRLRTEDGQRIVGKFKNCYSKEWFDISGMMCPLWICIKNSGIKILSNILNILSDLMCTITVIVGCVVITCIYMCFRGLCYFCDVAAQSDLQRSHSAAIWLENIKF